jgi:glycosyltransferase involved in cell wall biosynthesis
MNSLFTVAIPAFNEEKRIENVIKNYLNYSNDIIIVDKYSTDKTIEICNKFQNVRVINYPSGIDESEQTKMVNEIAYNDWILYATCSEISTIKLLQELKKIVISSNEYNYKAAVFNRISYTSGVVTHDLRYIYSNFKNGIFTRFMNKNFFDFENARIHFEAPVKAKPNEIYVIDYKIPLIHIRNDDVSSSEQKHARYAEIEAKSLLNKGVTGSYYRLFGRTIFNFIKIYYRNYKVGYPGFVTSILHALYVFQVELRLLSIKKNFTKEKIIFNNKKIIEKYYFEFDEK